jgi:hypothetical protein
VSDLFFCGAPGKPAHHKSSDGPTYRKNPWSDEELRESQTGKHAATTIASMSPAAHRIMMTNLYSPQSDYTALRSVRAQEDYRVCRLQASRSDRDSGK